MENIVAILGVFLFWASLLWLPLNAYRVTQVRGQPQIWTLAAILSFFMVIMGYTRAIDGGTVMEAFAWSISWLMPLGLTFFARSAPGVPLKTWDKFVGAAALVSFPLLLPQFPGLLQWLSSMLWGV